MRKAFKYVAFLFLVLGMSGLANAQTGWITGKVIDSKSEKVLTGVKIILKSTIFAVTSNIKGNFIITDVPPGKYEVIARCFGYNEVQMTVQIAANENTSRIIKMNSGNVNEAKTILTTQAEDQKQSAKQRCGTTTISNVVTEMEMQELPEASAAEAVGRLPGVYLIREGGEGKKVVIRGMIPKFTLIQIDGVNMTATGEGDRSSDISMISPYMLEGIELTKSIMANQEASVTGGVVNFRIKKAPETPAFNVIALGGANSLRNTYKNYKLSVGISKRFSVNRLGIFALADYENKDIGSQELGSVDFSQDNSNAPVRTNEMQLMDIFRTVKRLNGAVVLDYSLPSTEIKLSNYFGHNNREETKYINLYGYAFQSFGLSYFDTPKRSLSVMTNSLQFNHRWNNWIINSTFSHAYSDNRLPVQIIASNSNSPISPFPLRRNLNYNINLDPETIPDSLQISMDDAVYSMYLGDMIHEEIKTSERDLAGELNLAYTLKISNQINVKLSLGGKYKHKSKMYDFESVWIYGLSNADLIYTNFKNELSERGTNAWVTDNRLLLIDFLDQKYNDSDFFNGRYNFANIFDKEKFRQIHDLVMSEYNAESTNDFDIAQKNFVESVYNDYHGIEDYHAFYLMPELNLGSIFQFVPGVRYESNWTRYTGYRGNRLGVLRGWRATPIDTVSKMRVNEFFLPMIHAIVQPTNWLTFKAGYTHTLQRPDYQQIVPGWVINSQGNINWWGNFYLKPALSKNWDIQLSIQSNKTGLFSVGAFHKKISDMVFWTGTKFVIDPAFFELPPIAERGKIAYATNNPFDVLNYGYEVEWKSNFWYLPGVLKGLIVNVNYTYNKSEAKYLKSRVKIKMDPNTYKTTLVNDDTTYANPLIYQPDHLINFAVGYNYKGFSIRWAMQYRSKMFIAPNWYESLRGYSTDYHRHDLAIRQKLPIDGLEFFLNFYNLTNEGEREVIKHKDFATYTEDCGRRANMGLQLQL